MVKDQIIIEAADYNKNLKRYPSSEQELTNVLVGFVERLLQQRQLTLIDVNSEALKLIKAISDDNYLVGELKSSGYNIRALLDGKDWEL